jgi:hypothetical protein
MGRDGCRRPHPGWIAVEARKPMSLATRIAIGRAGDQNKTLIAAQGFCPRKVRSLGRLPEEIVRSRR